MNNVFDSVAYTDSDMDKIMVTDDDGNLVPVSEDVFNETYTTGPSLMYCKPDIREKMDQIHEAIKRGDKATGFLYFAEMLYGKKLATYQELFLTECFKYYEKKREDRICQLIENGVIVGAENGFDDSNVIKTIGNVMICQSPKGYYAITPSNFYMASEYFSDIESLTSSEVIDLMNDVYTQNSNGGVSE